MAKQKKPAKKTPAKAKKKKSAAKKKSAPKKKAKQAAPKRPKEKDPVRDNAGFYEMTGVMLLCGRKASWSGTGDELLACFDQLLKQCDHANYRVCPAQDLSRFDECRRRDNYITWGIGIKVMTGMAEEGPSSAFTIDQVRDVQRESNTLLDAAFWARVAEVVGDRISDSENIALMVPFGPLAGGQIAFGKSVADDTAAPAGLTLVRGTNMEQGAVDTAVLGVTVASGYDWDTANVDFSADAHAKRTSVAGADGAYFVVARYD